MKNSTEIWKLGLCKDTWNTYTEKICCGEKETGCRQIILGMKKEENFWHIEDGKTLRKYHEQVYSSDIDILEQIIYQKKNE